MNNCKDCALAEWARTKNGRINPKRGGRCTWRKVVHVPGAYNPPSFGRHVRGEPVVLEAGFIWRDSPHEKCPTFRPLTREVSGQNK